MDGLKVKLIWLTMDNDTHQWNINDEKNKFGLLTEYLGRKWLGTCTLCGAKQLCSGRWEHCNLGRICRASFDSEVAIKGFNFKVLTPKGETQELTLTHSKALSLADVKTDQAGTYAVTGLRTGELKYAKVGQRWLRVLDAKAEDLMPLAKRHFVTPSEVQAKTQQFTVQRFDQLLSYFSKQQYSEVKQDPMQQGLRLELSGHPNQISLKTPFRVKLNLGNKPASGFQVTLEKQATTLGEAEKAIQLETNGSGEVNFAIFSGRAVPCHHHLTRTV